MAKILSKPEYEQWTASTRDQRMAWWRDARFGMFVHFGLYSVRGMHEWQMVYENFPIEEYEKIANRFNPKPGAPREWAALAKKAGMKYMVLTTRHHDGFSLWDSKVNPYNSVNYGPKRDIVREYVDACREFGLGIGFYSSCMDWHHPDGGRAAVDKESRARFTQYIEGLNRELLTNYGKIDILWYDVSYPMESWEGWDALEINQKMRELQPDLLINNRIKLNEDFGTPEEHITAETRDWEACMTFNGLSWGYVDSAQAAPYSYNEQTILRMLHKVVGGGGNLLLNIGPMPDGSVPPEAIKPLETVGKWLEENGEIVYGVKNKGSAHLNGVTSGTYNGNVIYGWNWIWPTTGEMGFGGWQTKLLEASLLKDGTPIEFEQKGHRILLKNLPKEAPDKNASVSVIKLVFEERPSCIFASYYPQMHAGREWTTEKI